MSEMSKKVREARNAKAKRLADEPEGKVDASGYKVPGEMDTAAKAGPGLAGGKGIVHVRAYKRGGPVRTKCEGEEVAHHGGRKARAMGGPSMMPPQGGPPMTQVAQPPVNRMNFSPVPNRMGAAIGAFGAKRGGKIERAEGGKASIDAGKTIRERADEIRNVPKNVPDAAKRSQETGTQREMVRDKKLVWKRGGKIRHRDDGGSVPSDDPGGYHAGEFDAYNNNQKAPRKSGGKAMPSEISGTRPTGGRTAKAEGGLSERMPRASGGKTGKGKTNITIIVGSPKQQQPPMMPPGGPPMPPPHPPMPPPPGGPPAMGGPGGPPMPPPSMGGAGGPPQPVPPVRKAGGRVHNPGYPLKDGSGGGEGRMEKVEAYGRK